MMHFTLIDGANVAGSTAGTGNPSPAEVLRSGHCSLEVARAPVGSMLPSACPDVWPEAGLLTAPVTRSA
ncbi:unnamed protein product [Arctogadus glacialis]